MIEHKRLSVKTNDILAMQEPMLYTFIRWLCYNTNTSIDPTSIIVIIRELYGIMTRYHLMHCLCLFLFYIKNYLCLVRHTKFWNPSWAAEAANCRGGQPPAGAHVGRGFRTRLATCLGKRLGASGAFLAPMAPPARGACQGF